MKKPTFYLGEFTQRDKVFLTADNGIDVENVNSIAFMGETLYIAQKDCLIKYADGKMQKSAIRASKLFAKKDQTLFLYYIKHLDLEFFRFYIRLKVQTLF